MTTVKLEIDNDQQGAFVLYESEKKVGEMTVSISDRELTVYHTEIIPESGGKGYGKLLLDEMTAYARQQKIMVIPLCPFVFGYFKKNRSDFADIWKKAYG